MRSTLDMKANPSDEFLKQNETMVKGMLQQKYLEKKKRVWRRVSGISREGTSLKDLATWDNYSISKSRCKATHLSHFVGEVSVDVCQ